MGSLKLVALVVAAVGGASGLSDLLDRETITTINTALNFASVTMLIRASQRYRREVTPAIRHVETVVDEVLQPRTDGRRHYDA